MSDTLATALAPHGLHAPIPPTALLDAVMLSLIAVHRAGAITLPRHDGRADDRRRSFDASVRLADAHPAHHAHPTHAPRVVRRRPDRGRGVGGGIASAGDDGGARGAGDDRERGDAACEHRQRAGNVSSVHAQTLTPRSF